MNIPVRKVGNWFNQLLFAFVESAGKRFQLFFSGFVLIRTLMICQAVKRHFGKKKTIP